MAKRILKALNALVDFAVIFALLLAGAYSVYALWDNGRIYTAAENSPVTATSPVSVSKLLVIMFSPLSTSLPRSVCILTEFSSNS